MRKIAYGILLLWSLSAFAQPSLYIQGTGPDASPPPSRGGGSVLFSTFSGIAPMSTTITSQVFTDFGGFATNAADDFTVPASVGLWVIDTVLVDGAYFNVPVGQTPGPAQSVNVYIIGNSGGLPDTTNVSAGAIYAAENIGFIDPSNTGDFTIPLPGAGVSLPPGDYWLMVQVNMAVNQGGQWGWRESSAAPDTGNLVGFESAWFQTAAFIVPGCVNAWGARITTCGLTDTGDPTPPEGDLAFQLEGTALIPGVTVTPTSGLTTSEIGSATTFDVVLDSPPTANVTIGVSSSNLAEGTVSTALLTFTPADWNMAQTVTVTGVDDLVADGDTPYMAILAPATSGDPNYSGLDPDDVSLTNLDDDIPGITVAPTSGLMVDETGTTANFQVSLNTIPTGAVTVPISSPDTSEATVSTASLVFNDMTPQMVTVTGVDDFIDDGDVAFTIVTGDPSSSDPNYGNLTADDVADVTGVNADDTDTAGITVTPSGVEPLTTDETGLSATYDVVLDSEPTANVVITLQSTDDTEGQPSMSSLTFTPGDWSMPQTVTVTGQDDFLADGPINYLVLNGPAASADPVYDNLNAASVSFVNNDDADAIGVTVTPNAMPLVTDETGLTDTFDVVLDAQPLADVTITVTSTDTTEGTPSTALLTFTNLNWNMTQTVTVTGVDDSLADGPINYAVLLGDTMSADLSWNNVPVNDVACVNNDDADAVGVTVTPNNTPLQTTEAGGTDTFTVVLDSQPAAGQTVMIGFDSNNTAEITVSTTSLTFDDTDWNVPQMVTLTGQDENIDDGDALVNIQFTPTVSGDPDYNGLMIPQLNAVNIDDDTAGITVTAIEPLTTNEMGTTDTFTIVLDSEPTGNVSIDVSSGDQTEGLASSNDGNTITLVFTPLDYFTPQTVTITGQDDPMVDGDINYTIIISPAVSTDPLYSGQDPADLAALNQDDDNAGFIVTPTAGLITTEAGGTDTFTVELTSQPTADVNLPLSSSDTTEGTVSSPSLTFTDMNWNMPQTVTVTGVDDFLADGDQPYTIVTGDPTSADPIYDALTDADVPDVSVTNQETPGKAAGVTVNPTSGLVTTEAGGSDTYTVVLDTQPTADVTIPVASSDPTEGVAAPASLTFTDMDWNTPQTVTVTGVDDFDLDTDIVYTIQNGPAASADPDYNGLAVDDVEVTNINDDFCDPVGITCIIGQPIVIQGTPDCVIDVYDTQDSTNPANWILLASAQTIPPDGILTLSLICQPDTTYIVTVAGNPDQLLSNPFRTVPALGTWGLIAFVFLLLAAAVVIMRRRRHA